MTNKTLASIEARGAILGVVHTKGFLDLLGSFGYEESMVQPFAKIPLWTQLPITGATRNGNINIFASAYEMIRAYPHLSQFDDQGRVVTVSAPVISRNTVIGALGITAMRCQKLVLRVAKLFKEFLGCVDSTFANF